MVGRDGRPTQKSLRQMLAEWVEFRQATVQRRTQHRLSRVLERIHVLEGRLLVPQAVSGVIEGKMSVQQAADWLQQRVEELAKARMAEKK